jgi:predicted ArsR family transcriptional regulator
MPHSTLLKRMKVDTKTFRQVIETLIERGDLAVESCKTAGRDAISYRLAGGDEGKEGEGRVKEGGVKCGL